MDNIDIGYELIPLHKITDEARLIAVRWSENMKDSSIQQKHKLASDIMNYAIKHGRDKVNHESNMAKSDAALDKIFESDKNKKELDKICSEVEEETKGIRGISFDEYKSQFDESFSKESPEEFIARMESLGYKFEDIPLPKIVQYNWGFSSKVVRVKTEYGFFYARLEGYTKDTLHWTSLDKNFMGRVYYWENI